MSGQPGPPHLDSGSFGERHTGHYFETYISRAPEGSATGCQESGLATGRHGSVESGLDREPSGAADASTRRRRAVDTALARTPIPVVGSHVIRRDRQRLARLHNPRLRGSSSYWFLHDQQDDDYDDDDDHRDARKYGPSSPIAHSCIVRLRHPGHATAAYMGPTRRNLRPGLPAFRRACNYYTTVGLAQS